MTSGRKQTSEHSKNTGQKTDRPGYVNRGPEVLLEEPDRLELQRAVINSSVTTPATVEALQRRYGNQAVQRLLADRLQEAGQGVTHVKPEQPIRRQSNTVEAPSRLQTAPTASIQRDVFGTAKTAKELLSTMMCNQAVGYVLWKHGCIKEDEYHNTFRDTRKTFEWIGHTNEIKHPYGGAPENAVIGIEYRLGPNSWIGAHVMLSNGDGWAYGTNNGSIFGPQFLAWQKIDLSKIRDGGDGYGRDSSGRTVRLHYRVAPKTGP